MERLNHLLVAGLVLLIALTMVLPRSVRADESTIPSKLSSSGDPAPSLGGRSGQKKTNHLQAPASTNLSSSVGMWKSWSGKSRALQSSNYRSFNRRTAILKRASQQQAKQATNEKQARQPPENYLLSVGAVRFWRSNKCFSRPTLLYDGRRRFRRVLLQS